MIYEKQKTKNISFPLGGIGTGCIGLYGNGELNDWEIFNRPNKNTRNGYSHFAIKATCGGRSAVKVLHGDTNENLMGTPRFGEGHSGFGFGPRENSMAGFSHFQNVTFEGRFPLAELTFSDEAFPACVRLTAFNPMIPQDEQNSSLPAAFFSWEIENTAAEPMEVALACTVCNPARSTRNEAVGENGAVGLFLGSADRTAGEIGYSDLCILTDGEESAVQEYWYRGEWMDGCTTYWKNLSELRRMPARHYDLPSIGDHGTVVSYLTLAPKEKKSVRFIIAWNVPTAYRTWDVKSREEGEALSWKNYYATQFETSRETAYYALTHFSDLLLRTRTFADALERCTLPPYVKDAVTANLSVLKTPTVLRLEDGSLWGFEGCCETVGSCFGSCQHVWNYAYALPYLFPRLERSLRENTLKYALQDSGATSFRIQLPPRREMATARACLDGQMGEVIKCYREWKLSGREDWLREHAEDIFKMLEYAWSEENPDRWDADKDGILEGRQHHTLDMELFGPSSWLQGLYLLALDCAAEMADFLGQEKRAEMYRSLYKNGKEYLNTALFNGSYYCQRIDLFDRSIVDRFGAGERYWNAEAGEIKYQIAEGCSIDQMLADWHAALIGKAGVFEPEKKKRALASLYQNNYKSSMRGQTNMWRNFSLNDEAGTVICSYPAGVRTPAIPIPYSEETMTGFEYALAGLMLREGFIAEGESMIRAVRDRYDGEKRNPYNEIECGSNYARSMASFALLPIYSGFSFDMTKKHIGFSPLAEEGTYLFGVGESYGTVSFAAGECRLAVLSSPLTLASLSLPRAEEVRCVTADGRRIAFSHADGRLVFSEEVKITRELCAV